MQIIEKFWTRKTEDGNTLSILYPSGVQGNFFFPKEPERMDDMVWREKVAQESFPMRLLPELTKKQKREIWIYETAFPLFIIMLVIIAVTIVIWAITFHAHGPGFRDTPLNTVFFGTTAFEVLVLSIAFGMSYGRPYPERKLVVDPRMTGDEREFQRQVAACWPRNDFDRALAICEAAMKDTIAKQVGA